MIKAGHYFLLPLLKLKEILKIDYNFYIEGVKDLENFLRSNGFRFNKALNTWRRVFVDGTLYLKISDEIFEKNKLKYFKQSEWKDSFVESNFISNPRSDNDDLPF